MLPEYEIEEPQKSKIKIAVLAAGLAAVLVAAFLIYFVTKINQAKSETSVPVDISIKKGLSTKAVGQALAEKRLIANPWVFSLYVYLQSAQGKIQAGEYLLDKKMSISEMAQIMTAGKVVQNERRITVIEGWNNKQISAYLQQRNIVEAQAFEKALKGDFEFSAGGGSAFGGKFSEAKKFDYQGFLFPDTYTLSKKSEIKVLVEKMLANFEKKTADLNITPDVIILASIIEKEVGRNGKSLGAEDLRAMEKERRLVASVFYNRLKAGMALQSDATVNYITGKQDRQVLTEDTKIKSPYNTYLYRRLPPGPISNPGLDSIRAALDPAESDYLYFLNKIDGEAVFARTLAEHNVNKAKFLNNN